MERDENAKQDSDTSAWEGSLPTLGGDCVVLHELFTSLVAAGFTEKQALYYMAAVMSIANAT